jgi:hypothetical protein
MNATKPGPAASPDTPSEDTTIRERAQRRPAAAERASEKPPGSATSDGDVERHDTIPAPTWLDDGSESS